MVAGVIRITIGITIGITLDWNHKRMHRWQARSMA